MTLKGRKALEHDNNLLLQYVQSLKTQLESLLKDMQPLVEGEIEQAREHLDMLRNRYKKALDEQTKRSEEAVRRVAE